MNSNSYLQSKLLRRYSSIPYFQGSISLIYRVKTVAMFGRDLRDLSVKASD